MQSPVVVTSDLDSTFQQDSPIAVLPPCLLWAASFATSRDPVKRPLDSIDVRRTDTGGIRVGACDGHRLFKVVIPMSEHFYISDEQKEPFLLNASAFSKAPTAKTVSVSLSNNGIARFETRAGLSVGEAIWRPSYPTEGLTYPDVDKLIPAFEELTCNPEKAVAFNARYVSDFCKVVERLSNSNNVRFYTTNSAIAPCILKATLDSSFLLGKSSDICLSYLIMPVQIRT